MLTLRKLTLEDFGPYRGIQSIEFESRQGVYIAYGPNGRGKTTLHNAFRYALYGEILGRRRSRRAEEMANTQSARQRGHAYFRTVLEFEANGEQFRLTRRFDQSASAVETVLLEKNGTPLSQVATAATLKAIAPGSVSQFFLFDGELLRQYENLLDPDSEEGEALEEAIERVLGVPVVANALLDVKGILRQSQSQVADLYAANDATQRKGLALKEAQDLRSEYLRSQAELSDRIGKTHTRVAELEAQLKEQEKSQRILGSLDALRSARTALEGQEREAIARLSEVSPSLWKAVLADDLAALAPQYQDEVNSAQQRVFEASAAIRDMEHLEHHSDCPTCSRELDPALRHDLITRLGPSSEREHQHFVERELTSARRNLETLQRMLTADSALIADRDRALRRTRLELRTNAEDIDDLEEQLAGIDEGELRALAGEREERILQIARDRERLSEVDGQVHEQEAAIDGLMKLLAKESVKVDEGVELRQEVTQALTSLLAESIDAYRAALRSRVETSASEVFRELSAESDYTALRITERYGLEIIDADGQVVQSRSAGYEHLVALSLIAALQDSAAVRGPVIMDYPFGRLDAQNTANVVAALPRMARQVVLLAFDGEFDRDEALKALGSDLIAEYTLSRVTSKNTRIDRRSA